MTYKTELHCHTNAVSACAKLTPERVVERYIEAGYTTLVLTDHLSRATYDASYYMGKRDWESMIDHFLSSCTRAREAAGDRLHILLGCEVRIDCHDAADYLIYGLTEEFLRANPFLMRLKFKYLSAAVREAGMLLIQAHPFRNGMVVTDPTLLDGVEVYNAVSSHASRNDIAEIWANRYKMIKTGGSDMHREEHVVASGIETDFPITSNEQLLATLRGGNYQIIRGGTPGKDYPQ